MRLLLRCLILFWLGCLLAIGISAVFLPVFSQSEPASSPSAALAQTPSAQRLVEQGRTYYQQGQWEAAIAPWQTALEHSTIQTDALQQAILWSYLAMAYQKVGQWENGEGAIANSLQILDNLPNDRERTHLLAQTLNTQGQLAFAQGQPEAALELWQQTADLYQDLGHVAGITGSLINQSRALETLGHHRRACQTLLTAIDLGDHSCDAKDGLAVDAIVEAFQQQPDGPLQILGLRSLGNVLRLTGQLSAAQQLLSQSVALAEEQARPQQQLLSLLSLGKAEQTLYEQAAYRYGQTGSAEEASTLQAFANQALARYTAAEALAQARPRENAALLSQVSIQHLALLVNLQAEQWPDTLFPTLTTQLKEQLSTVKNLPTLPPSHANFYTQINLAQSYITLLRSQSGVTISSPTEVIALLTQVEQQAADLNDTQTQSYALGTLGRLYEQLAQQHPDLYPDLLQQAQQITKAALQLADQDNHIAYQWQWQLGRIYTAQQDEAQAIAAYQTAVETLQTLRQDLVAIESATQFSFRDTVEPLYR
ncbi:MAG: tetratricopeptide repeat protein, partial [Cyanobacteria bacterium P01_F01_bin.4]